MEIKCRRHRDGRFDIYDILMKGGRVWRCLLLDFWCFMVGGGGVAPGLENWTRK